MGYLDIVKKSFVGGIVFAITVFGVSYAANLSSYTETAKSGDSLTADWANSVKEIVPSGAVMAFNLNICPDGWSQANGESGKPDLRGVFIRGMESFDGGITENARDPDRTGTATLGTYQADEYKSHGVHARAKVSNAGSVAGGTHYGPSRLLYDLGCTSGNCGGNETRGKNIALLYCVKD